MKEVLKASDGKKVYAREGASCVCTFTFKDALNVELDKASLLTLKMSLRDAETGTIINNRLDKNVKDENNGTVSNSGVLTLKLQPEDNIIIGAATMREEESHFIEFVWTWIDQQGASMTGAKTFELLVCGSSY